MLCLWVVTIILNFITKKCGSNNINIGAIFEGPDYDAEMAFRVAIDMANDQYGMSYYTFTSLIANIEPEDIVNGHRVPIGMTWDRPFEALNMACSFVNSGVVGILGTFSEFNSNAIQSVCDNKEIPFIRTIPEQDPDGDCCSINLFPRVPVIAKAYADLVLKWNWKNFTIMYDTDYSFAGIAEVLQLYNGTGHAITLEQLLKSEYGDYRDIFKKIRRSGQKNFLLHCVTENLGEILQQIQQVGLLRKGHSFIILNLDVHTIDLSSYQHSESQITWLQLVDPKSPLVMKTAQAIQHKYKELGLQLEELDINTIASSLDIWTALIVDAVILFAEALNDIANVEVNSLSCNATDSWTHGSTLFNFMKMKTIDGLTGFVQFDQQGLRTDFSLNVIELTEEGIQKIGTWNSKEGFSMSKEYSAAHGIYEGNEMRNISLNVMIAWSEPYALYKNDTAVLKGNDQYEGFVIDLIREISLIEGFNYTLLRNPDDRNGDYNSTTKSWNGMIGDILNGMGDIAIGDLTITRQRQEVVDFTTPFMSTGIQILYKKPSQATPLFFSFASPFAPKVWLWIGIAYFAVSLALYIMARFCSSEWDNWDPCVQNPRFYFNQFNVKNSLWYMLGCLMQEGANIAPRAASTRVLSSVWAFFILVIVSYYKAQLAASLTVESYELPFRNAEDLVNKAEQLGIRYGAVDNEAVYYFFKQSPIKFHQKIAAYMDAHPENMVYDNYEGYLLIEEGNYAFFTDSVFVQFATQVVCYLISIGDPISEQNLAIAVKKDTPYRAPLSKAILKLLESGKIAQLQKKWWEYFTVESCKGTEISSIAPPLNYYHVAGIFWITFAGVFLACILVFFEVAIHIFNKCGWNYQKFKKEFKKELLFYFAFRNTTKPVRNGHIVDIKEAGSNNDVTLK